MNMDILWVVVAAMSVAAVITFLGATGRLPHRSSPTIETSSPSGADEWVSELLGAGMRPLAFTIRTGAADARVARPVVQLYLGDDDRIVIHLNPVLGRFADVEPHLDQLATWDLHDDAALAPPTTSLFTALGDAIRLVQAASGTTTVTITHERV